MHTNEKKPNKPTDLATVNKEATDLEKRFIDIYSTNGFNKVQAAVTVKPDCTYNTCNVWAQQAFRLPRVKNYLKSRQMMLKEETKISSINILKELLSFAYSDVTVFMGLSEDEVKALPNEVTRCIKDIDTTTKSWINPVTKGVEKEVTVKIRLIDKLKAIDMIAKHIDLYNADNTSKSPIVNLSSATNEQLNAVRELMEAQEQANKNVQN